MVRRARRRCGPISVPVLTCLLLLLLLPLLPLPLPRCHRCHRCHRLLSGAMSATPSHPQRLVVQPPSPANLSFLSQLPPEISFDYILSPLPLRDLFALAATSKDWHAIIFNNATLWRFIHAFKSPPSLIGDTIVSHMLTSQLGPLSLHSILEINLDHTDITSQSLSTILIYCPNVTTLSARYCPKISLTNLITELQAIHDRPSSTLRPA